MPNVVRIRDLVSETDLTNAYVPIDKVAYASAAKKIFITDIVDYMGVICGVTFDIVSGDLTIEASYGYYVTSLDGRYAVYLDDLQDVSGATSPNQNDVLVYKSNFWTKQSNFISGFTFDTSTGIISLNTAIGNFSYDLDGRWATELDELLDVNITYPQDNDVLVYSGGIWVNSAATFGTGGAGTSGSSGDAGTSGSSGLSGVEGSSGSSGDAGTSGSSGTSGMDGTAILPITYGELGMDLMGRTTLDYAIIDWDIYSIWTKTLTGNTTLSFTNLRENKQISLIVSGNYTLTLPGTSKIINGVYDGTVTNFIQLYCSNSGTSEVWVSINKQIV